MSERAGRILSGLALAGSTGNSHMDELKGAKANAGSAVNRSPNLTGDAHELGRPAQASSADPVSLLAHAPVD